MMSESCNLTLCKKWYKDFLKIHFQTGLRILERRTSMGELQGYRRIMRKFTSGSDGINLRSRMLATFIPVVIMTLLVTGYLTYQTSTGFLRTTLENQGRIHLASLVHEIEQLLERCRKDLILIAQESPNSASLNRYMTSMKRAGGIDYLMLGFISLVDGEHAIFVSKGGVIERIPAVTEK